MSSPIRMLLALVLALAIPLQGFAAASMLLCGPGHGGRGATLAAGPSHHAAGAPDHHGASGGHEPAGAHHAGADVADDANGSDTAAADEAQSPPAKSGKPGTGKCSICASCCSGCAIVDTLPPHVAAVADDERVVEPSVALIGIVPPLLERPPRT